jgi:glycosyltransferase involved in cell wall biosynthesis
VLFSVVIPTRNRLPLVGNAIQSVLRQDFGDFEIVVSDNSDAAVARKVAELVRCSDDSRVRYVRPPHEMSMGEHWEFAIGEIRGDYAGYLTDRTILKPDALSRIKGQIEAHDPNLITYTMDHVIGEFPPYRLQRPRFSGRTYVVESRWVIGLFAKLILPMGVPAMLNSFTKGDIVKDMIRTYGEIMNSVAPDLCYCVHALDYLDRYHYYDYPLALAYGAAYSNAHGFATGRDRDASMDFKAKLVERGGLRYAPIPAIMTNHNVRAHEYCRMRSSQRSGGFVELDAQHYYMALRSELGLQGRFASREAKALLHEYANTRDLASPDWVFYLRQSLSWLRRSGLFLSILQLINRTMRINPLSSPVGRFKTFDEVFEYYGQNAPRTTTAQADFLSRIDRMRAAGPEMRSEAVARPTRL